MPGTENQPSFLGRLSIRRNQVVSMEGSHEQELEELELFQRHVADRFSDLLVLAIHDNNDNNNNNNNNNSDNFGSDRVLSISWLRKLVDVFLCCEAEFKAFLIMGRDTCQLTKSPLDRLLHEHLDRTVKVLDICNAVSNGVDNVRQCQRLGEMAVNALKLSPVGDGQVKRAKKALNSLLIALTLEEKEDNNNNKNTHYNKSTERVWSFGRRGNSNNNNNNNNNNSKGVGPAGSFRSFSMIVAKNWSAAKQIQAMCSNLVAPRGGGEAAGMATPVYIMSVVMVFSIWVLVAAVPCQERTGLVTHIQIPRNMGWAQGVVALQERIGEEWKRKEKKGGAGLMDEMQKLERLANGFLEVFSGEGFRYPLAEENEAEVAAMVTKMGEVCRRMEEGLVPLQQQIREVFHRVVRSRSEVLELLDHAGKAAQPSI